MYEKIIQEKLSHIPATREGRMSSIIETLKAHPEGLNLQHFISQLTLTYGLTRPKIIEYFKALERAKLIRLGRYKVFAV